MRADRFRRDQIPLRRRAGIVVADQRRDQEIVVIDQRARAGIEAPASRRQHRLVVAVVALAHEQARHVFDGVFGVLEIDGLVDLFCGDAVGLLRQLEPRDRGGRAERRVGACAVGIDDTTGELADPALRRPVAAGEADAVRCGLRAGRAAWRWTRRLDGDRRQGICSSALGIRNIDRRQQRQPGLRQGSRHRGHDNETWNDPDTGPMAGLLNGIDRRRQAAPICEVRCQEMDGGARACACEPAREPNRSGVNSTQTTRSVLAIDADGLGGLRHVDRRAGLQHAANRTASVMGAVAGLVGLAGAGRRIAVTDHGGRRAGRTRRCWPPSRRRSVRKSAPPGRSGRLVENSSAACASQTHPMSELITLRVRSRDQVPGFILPLLRK